MKATWLEVSGQGWNAAPWIPGQPFLLSLPPASTKRRTNEESASSLSPSIIPHCLEALILPVRAGHFLFLIKQPKASLAD